MKLVIVFLLITLNSFGQLNGYFGKIRLSPKNSVSATDGTIYYNSDSGKFVFRQSGTWVDFIPSYGPSSVGNIKGNLTAGRLTYAVSNDSITGDSTLTWNTTTKKLRLSNNLNLSSNGDLIALTQTASTAATGYNLQIGFHPPLNDGDHNINIGNYSGYQQTAASHFNVTIGEQACSACSGASENTAVGYRAIQSAKGEDNAGFGFGAGMALGSGAYTSAMRNNNFMGYYTASAQLKGGTPPPYDYIDGNNSLFLGAYAGTGDVAGQTESGQVNLNHVLFSRYNTDANPPPFPQTGNIGIYVPMPKARLHIPAGAATADKAPLKFTAGTNLTVTEAGTLEYDGTNLYFTATNGGARTQLNIFTLNAGSLIVPTLPTGCGGLPTGTLWNNGGVLSICP